MVVDKSVPLASRQPPMVSRVQPTVSRFSSVQSDTSGRPIAIFLDVLVGRARARIGRSVEKASAGEIAGCLGSLRSLVSAAMLQSEALSSVMKSIA